MNPATEITDRLCVGKTERQQHLLRAVRGMITDAYCEKLELWMAQPGASMGEYDEAFYAGVNAAILLHDFVMSMDRATVEAELARMEGGA